MKAYERDFTNKINIIREEIWCECFLSPLLLPPLFTFIFVRFDWKCLCICMCWPKCPLSIALWMLYFYEWERERKKNMNWDLINTQTHSTIKQIRMIIVAIINLRDDEWKKEVCRKIFTFELLKRMCCISPFSHHKLMND